MRIADVVPALYRATLYADGVFGDWARDGVRSDAHASEGAAYAAEWPREESAGREAWRLGVPDRSSGEFWVAAVLPDYEGRGIGRSLVERGQQWLHAEGWKEIWLWTSPDANRRAYKLYITLGWRDCGVKDGQLIMRHAAIAPDPPVNQSV